MRIFIASSKEALEKARTVAVTLEEFGHSPILWDTPGIFIASQFTLESLEEISEKVDAAVIVFSEDDKTWYREDRVSTVRDNVLIELGLFLGKLSRKSVVICKSGDPKLATDLLGINIINVDLRNRATVDLKSWIDKIYKTEIKDAGKWIRIGNFNKMFNEICSYGFFKTVKVYAISTNRTVRIMEGCERLHIDKAEVLLRKYCQNDPYYDSHMENSIETSINLWRGMNGKKIINDLVVRRFNYHIDTGIYIFDKSFLIIGNLHFTYPKISVEFDRNAILITDQSKIGLDIIDWYTEKFDKIFANF